MLMGASPGARKQLSGNPARISLNGRAGFLGNPSRLILFICKRKSQPLRFGSLKEKRRDNVCKVLLRRSDSHGCSVRGDWRRHCYDVPCQLLAGPGMILMNPFDFCFYKKKYLFI